ncbi:MAG: glutamate--tRNA ligase family protein, partial [Pseudomonadota bacterium]
HLCSVIDDAELGITHVIRAEDHVANTAAHVQMFKAIGADVPQFAHTPLLVDTDGKALSKRLGSLSLEGLRGEGYEAMAIVSLLARLGTSDPIEPFDTIQPLIDGFDFSKFARATPRFDTDALDRLNARIVHDLPFAAVADRLATLGLGEVDEAFWQAVRPNLGRLSEIDHWWKVTHEPVQPNVIDSDFVSHAADLLPAEPWDAETWSSWIAEVKGATGRKGKNLFMPLRAALTGEEHGPELAVLLPLIGRERAEARLRGQSA